MDTTDITTESTDTPRTAEPSRWWPALAGAIAVAAALGFSELVAGVLSAIPSLIAGVATVVIDTVPAPVKEWAIETFGTADKVVLGIGIVVVALALGAAIGRTSRRTKAIVFGLFGLVAGLATARSPQFGIAVSVGAGLAAGAVGFAVQSYLDALSTDRYGGEDRERRSFLTAAGALGVLAVSAGIMGLVLGERTRRAVSGRANVVLPDPVDPVAAPGPAESLDVPGITPIVVPNDEFYRIDTAPLAVPQVDIDTWTLRVSGLVDRETVFDFEDLLAMPLVERYVTLSCVSNEVGGGLVGNAKWLGVPLADVLERAGVAPSAEQVVGRSVDGFTVGFPVETVFDGRDALVAIGMNGEPLPAEHGYPARLVVAGLYGYVSATKWLSEIELTTWDGFDAYWIPRGWSKLGPVKTQSRIDAPRNNADIPAGTTAVAGVAWAPDRGIARVEVSIDDGDFEEATISEPLSDSAWIQWRYEWQAQPGAHTIQVRATDGTGETQTEEISRPAPDGATGWHSVSVTVV